MDLLVELSFYYSAPRTVDVVDGIRVANRELSRSYRLSEADSRSGFSDLTYPYKVSILVVDTL